MVIKGTPHAHEAGDVAAAACALVQWKKVS